MQDIFTLKRGGWRNIKGVEKADEDKFLSRDEFQALLDEAGRDPRLYGKHAYDLFAICGNLGLRCVEALDLQFKDFNSLCFDHIRVRSAKKGVKIDERVYVGSDEKSLLEWIIERRRNLVGGDFLFPFCSRTARYLFAYYAGKASVSPNVSFHSLRHTAARMLKSANNEDIGVVKERLRHAFKRGAKDITLLYIKPSREQMVEAANKKGVVR